MESEVCGSRPSGQYLKYSDTGFFITFRAEIRNTRQTGQYFFQLIIVADRGVNSNRSFSCYAETKGEKQLWDSNQTLKLHRNARCFQLLRSQRKQVLTTNIWSSTENTKQKIDYNLLKESDKKDGKLILVTAINPTPAGEGKTTTTVGLADGMQRLGKSVMVALREPSLGPVFGVKGGAAGGGYAQVVPMEDINLHFTGDFHAIGAANNLLAAMIDNHIFQGNALNIDPRKITWRRCVDMNDRQLRNVVDGLGGRTNGMPREDGYDITVASEIMAVLCLASDIKDLKERLSRIIIGYTYGKVSEQKPVTAGDLHAEGAMTALLKDALKPNLVQTLEHVPAIVHGGPFANIAHGCNSVTATRMAMKLADYAITEAGFGAALVLRNSLISNAVWLV